MRLRNIFFLFTLFALCGLGGWLYMISVSDKDDEASSALEENVDVRVEVPVFVWSFEEAQTYNLDGQPEKDIYLAMTYESGPTLRQFIATSPSSCNELPEATAESLSGTKDIQCYGAGLGVRFRIVRGQEVYLVERQTFEEGTRDMPGQVFDYEAVMGFPITLTN